MDSVSRAAMDVELATIRGMTVEEYINSQIEPRKPMEPAERQEFEAWSRQHASDPNDCG